ncbi:uncharacterized protein LOC130499529 [Raphanus sativus]|uniref:Uncharacterized protein LOC130499529 n=1 Tax=Raphanus sativus TaxID=3726 RepID=A0A9W3CDB7_RAPSA|nr:uncharacterized protein LOC130499529 [Raphanus sativus]
MTSKDERSRPGNSFVGLSNLQMRKINDSVANLIHAGLEQIHQKLDEIQGVQQTRPKPAARRERPRRTNRSNDDFGEREFPDGDSKSQKKSTSTHAHVAEPSIFISEKPKGKSECSFEDLKDFSDSLPIFDEYDDEPTESLMNCEDTCDFPTPESELMLDSKLTCFEPEPPSSLILSSQDFEEEPFNQPHHGRLPGTRTPLDDDLGPIFDEEDDLGPVFDEEAPSINMDSHLCFDPGTTPPILSTDIQEHCEKLDLIYSLPELFVGISSHNVKSFGLDNVKEFCVSNSIFDNMIHSFEKLEPDKLFDQKCFLNDNDISSGLVLSFDQFLKHHKGFDHLEKSFELVLQQPDFCFRKLCDSFVCFKDNWFDLSFSSHGLITGDLFAFPCALDEFMVKTLLEQKSLRTETDSCCDSDLKPAPSYFESDLDLKFLCSEYDQPRLVLNMFYGVSCLESILICNTFFEKHIEPWKS